MSLAKRLNKLGGGNNFEQLIGNAFDLSVKSQNKPRKTRPNIKPSKAGCIRQMFYILAEFPVRESDSVNVEMTMIQKEGTVMHGVLQEILAGSKEQGIEFLDPVKEVAKARQMGINTEVRRSSHDTDDSYEVTCYNTDFDISFKFDGTITFQSKKFILEIKNEDHFKWTKRIKPDPDHVLQATLYSLCLSINYVLFWYQNRNYQRKKLYMVEITEEMRQEQIMRIKIAKFCKEHKIVPAKTNHKGCTYCAYKSSCKKHGDITHEGHIDPELFDKFKFGRPA